MSADAGAVPGDAGERARRRCPSRPPAAAQRVLQRPHRLQDTVLALAPHYPFLEPLPPDTKPPPDTEPPPDMEPLLDVNPLDVDLLDTELPPVMVPPLEPAPPPAALPPAPARLEAAEPQASRPVPEEPPAAVPEGPGDGDMAGDNAAVDSAAGDEDVTIAGWCQEGLAQDEVLVPAELGAVRYLQRHYQDLLGSIDDVSLLPLEGDDIAGFRVSRGRAAPGAAVPGTELTVRRRGQVRGEPGRCRAAAEFVQSLLGSVGTQSVTLCLPGVARFLRDSGGQSVLRQLERRYQCVAHLHGAAWSPPDPQVPPQWGGGVVPVAAARGDAGASADTAAGAAGAAAPELPMGPPGRGTTRAAPRPAR